MSNSAQTLTMFPFPDPPAANLLQTNTSIDSILAQSLVDPIPTAPTPSPAPLNVPVGSVHKESGPVSETPINAEATPLVEVSESEPLPTEVESWLQKLDAAGEIKLPEPITHDGEVLLADTEAQVIKEKLVLPVSQTGLNSGLKSKVSESARWLAEWCTRLVKMMKGEVKYAPEENIYGKN